MRPRLNRSFIALAHDTVMAGVAFLMSAYLRLGDSIVNHPQVVTYALAFAATGAAVFWFAGLYNGIWRYASLPDLMAIARAVTVTILLFSLVTFILLRGEGLPRSTLVIAWFVLMAMLGGPRFLYRVIKDRGLDHLLERDSVRPIPVLLVGAGDAAESFIREMQRDRRALYAVVGIVGETPTRVGRRIHGVPVLGHVGTLTGVLDVLDRRGKRPQRIIIANPHASGALIRTIFEWAESVGIKLARLPRLTDFRDTGKTSAQVLRSIAIEDLLGRPQTVHDREAMAELIQGRRVLVTGAGGTIGSELVRQIAELRPDRLVLVDNAEYQLYTIDLELSERYPALSRTAALGDVRDRQRVQDIFAAERPQIVFHAAALKHVPMVEAHPVEGIQTNILGTRNVAEAAREVGVALMVLVSTDKAVNPVNVMGASKRVAESICQALDIASAERGSTRFVTVRFGNVLGSTGSVVPLFQRQLARGGPLTVTHPDVTRYFMTVREAVELILQSSAIGLAPGTGTGKIFVLDMGEPVRIADLARQMIRLAGLRPDHDVKITFTGLRPGEKVSEELFHATETLLPTVHAGIRLAAPRTADYALLSRALDELEQTAVEHDGQRALALLARLVPEFQAAGLQEVTDSSRSSHAAGSLA